MPSQMAESAQSEANQRTLGTFEFTQTKEEDELVMSLVLKHGAKNWTYIAKHLPGRIGKQCRERWHNHLNPDIKKERWTEE